MLFEFIVLSLLLVSVIFLKYTTTQERDKLTYEDNQDSSEEEADGEAEEDTSESSDEEIDVGIMSTMVAVPNLSSGKSFFTLKELK